MNKHWRLPWWKKLWIKTPWVRRSRIKELQRLYDEITPEEVRKARETLSKHPSF